MAILIEAHVFTPSTVREIVDPGRPGAYLLGHDEGGFVVGYVGRSDRCLRDRLALHELMGEFDQFAVQYARGPEGAFLLECEGWHACRQAGVKLLNRIHPAVPRGVAVVCPYCHFADHARKWVRAA